MNQAGVVVLIVVLVPVFGCRPAEPLDPQCDVSADCRERELCVDRMCVPDDSLPLGEGEGRLETLARRGRDRQRGVLADVLEDGVLDRRGREHLVAGVLEQADDGGDDSSFVAHCAPCFVMRTGTASD